MELKRIAPKDKKGQVGIVGGIVGGIGALVILVIVTLLIMDTLLDANLLSENTPHGLANGTA